MIKLINILNEMEIDEPFEFPPLVPDYDDLSFIEIGEDWDDGHYIVEYMFEDYTPGIDLMYYYHVNGKWETTIENEPLSFIFKDVSISIIIDDIDKLEKAIEQGYPKDIINNEGYLIHNETLSSEDKQKFLNNYS